MTNWIPETPWFDAAVVLGLFALGNVLFGHFEMHKPRWKRALKVLIVTSIIVLLSQMAGRVYAFGMLGALLGFAVYVHAVWLPQRGVNGWTGEPRARYLRLVGAPTGKEMAEAHFPPDPLFEGDQALQSDVASEASPGHETPRLAVAIRTVDRALGWSLVLFGCVHNFIAAPLSFQQLSTTALWFVTGGMALWYAGFINLMRSHDANSTRMLRILCVLTNLSLLVFVLTFASVRNNLFAPASLALIGTVVLLTAFSLVSNRAYFHSKAGRAG
ncbi:MAG: hypothetical protein JNM76_13700 [Betaproteobacteria bacterium]|nr:hypothetical protein [Betaproteobacteria bacterium]